MSFSELNLSESLLRAVREAEYQAATPIQTKAIPHILAGRDCLGCAQTGTGKTAAFALPTLQRLERSSPLPRSEGAPPRSEGALPRSQNPLPRRRPIRTLVLAPTRELAVQINDSFRTYSRHTGLRHTVIYGGIG